MPPCLYCPTRHDTFNRTHYLAAETLLPQIHSVPLATRLTTTDTHYFHLAFLLVYRFVRQHVALIPLAPQRLSKNTYKFIFLPPIYYCCRPPAISHIFHLCGRCHYRQDAPPFLLFKISQKVEPRQSTPQISLPLLQQGWPKIPL